VIKKEKITGKNINADILRPKNLLRGGYHCSMPREVKTRVLVIAAHPDDEILGAYSFLSNKEYVSKSLIVCEGSSARYAAESNSQELSKDIALREMASIKAAKILENEEPAFLNFPNIRLSNINSLEVQNLIAEELKQYCPKIVITHSAYCNNRDHVEVNKLVGNVIRGNVYKNIHTLLSMEIPSSTEQNFYGGFLPNYYVSISEKQMNQKIDLLRDFGTELQIDPAPRSIFGIKSLANYRGTAINENFAEAFSVLRMIKRN
jgi:LmbE family N-acetylglucosaminyl deacetylase